MPYHSLAAAFGRLCVETSSQRLLDCDLGAAAFGRLCVETAWLNEMVGAVFAAAFGRLCVETSYVTTVRTNQMDAAAFGRLCVETPSYQYIADVCEMQPPSGGCVLKLPIKS